MKNIINICLVCVSVLMFGCSAKKHFKPQLLSGEVHFENKLDSEIKASSREGAVLQNGKLLTYKDGVSHIMLEKGHRFLVQRGDVYVLQKECGEILLIQGENSIQNIPFEQCVLSADFRDNKLAMVLVDNTLMYFDVSNQKEIFSQKYPSVLAVNTYLASPRIDSEYVIFPDLEGKILVYSKTQNKIIKDILVSSDKFFNNVIYTHVDGKYLLAATAKRVSAVVEDKSFKYDVDLRDVLFVNDRIYVLSVEGEIIELDRTLKELRKVQLPFAILSGIVVRNNSLYTLEKGGYLIELDLQSFIPLVYKHNLKKKQKFFYNLDTFFYHKAYKRFQ